MILGRVFRSWSNTEPKKENKPKQLAQIMNTTRQNDLILPNQLSGRILDLEIQCEGASLKKQTIYQLIALYTKAVEFYQQKGDPKYKSYQKRMQNFLNRPVVECLLKGKKGQMIIKKEQNVQILRKAEDKAEKQVKDLLEKHELKQKKQEEIIKQLLTKQQNNLQQRIKRKRTNSNRSFNSKNTDFTLDNNQDINNQESNKKVKEILNRKLLISGIEERNKVMRKVFL